MFKLLRRLANAGAFLALVLFVAPAAFAAEPTPCQEMHRGYGVEAEEREPGVWVIRVFVTTETSWRSIYDCAEIKAAELAAEQGFSHFVFDDWRRANTRSRLRRRRLRSSALCGSRGQGMSSSCGFGAYESRTGRGNSRSRSRSRSRPRRRYNEFDVTLQNEPADTSLENMVRVLEGADQYLSGEGN